MANSIYKRASKKRLRFAAPKGNLSVEQLWTLKIEDLDAMAVTLKRKIDTVETDSFLKPKTNTELTNEQLRLDIMKDIIETRMADKEKAEKAKDTKDQRERARQMVAELNEAETKKVLEKMTPDQRAKYLEEMGA